MSNHVEWVEAVSAAVTYEGIYDQHGVESDGPALLIHTGSSTVAIEGTRQELLDLLFRAKGILVRDRYTLENGSERDVNEDTDYLCPECSTDTLEIWHEEA